MKKPAILFFVMFLCIETFGQAKKQSIGFECSPTLRSLRGTFGELFKPGFGFAAGLTYQYHVNNFISVKSGIGYEKKGATTGDVEFFDQEDKYIGTSRLQYNSNYLIIPLLASVSDKKGHFSISSGPYFGYLIRFIEKYDAIGSYPGEKTNMTKDAVRMDFGWILGIGYDLAISEKVSMSVAIRDDLGIRNLSKGSTDLRTNSLGLRLGLKYNLE